MHALNLIGSCSKFQLFLINVKKIVKLCLPREYYGMGLLGAKPNF
jgi:hypothetical protein